MKKKLQKIAALSLTFYLSAIPVLAMNFKDIDTDFWGYPFINDVAQRGLITADATGFFYPNDNINKFDAAKILAKTAGYKYTDLTDDEKNFYDTAYNNYKDLLAQQAQNYSKWQSISDHEITFLLQKNIFTPDDLEKFIVKSGDVEKLRALSKEEAAVYLVKIIGATPSISTEKLFLDDAFIAAEYKPYVYYLYENKILTGDENNKFNPKSAVTKTTMSVMLSKTLKFAGNNESNDFLSGTVDKVYSGISALQIISDNGQKNIYKVSSDAQIIVDGVSKTLDAIKENMTAKIQLNNSIIVSINAQSYNSNPDNDKNLKTLIAVMDSATSNSIDIKMQILNPTGGIITETRKYILADNCKVSKNNAPINLNSIAPGEIVQIKFADSLAYSICVVDKNRKIDGVLTGKKYDNANACLVIKDNDDMKYELKVTSDTFITRKNNGQVSWSDLKIGDKISASAEYNNLLDVYAEGKFSNKEGLLEEVIILKDSCAIIKIRDNSNFVSAYNISPGKIDIYSLRVNSRVRVNLDSNEVDSIAILDKAEVNYFGEVMRIFDNTILKIKTDNGNEFEIQCNKNTRFKNVNGREATIAEIWRGDKIYVVMDDNGYAKSINVVYKK